MASNFETAAALGALLAKEHAAGVFRLLANYQTVSASEAASLLDLHIQTAQDFLEVLAAVGIAAKEEVYEGKRPYFRYALKNPCINMNIDLIALFRKRWPADAGRQMIREKKNAKVRFAVGRDNASISHVALWLGEGRKRVERKVSLTQAQGRFLFHLPFPSAEHKAVSTIMKEAGIAGDYLNEIMELVELLQKNEVVEEKKGG